MLDEGLWFHYGIAYLTYHSVEQISLWTEAIQVDIWKTYGQINVVAKCAGQNDCFNALHIDTSWQSTFYGQTCDRAGWLGICLFITCNTQRISAVAIYTVGTAKCLFQKPFAFHTVSHGA